MEIKNIESIILKRLIFYRNKKCLFLPNGNKTFVIFFQTDLLSAYGNLEVHFFTL
jgi:hypothetical protein